MPRGERLLPQMTPDLTYVKEASTLRRDDFGPGDAGQQVFDILSRGAQCEVYLDRKYAKGKPIQCEEMGTGSVDLYGYGFEFTVVCGKEHRDKQAISTSDWFEEHGRIWEASNSISFNGFPNKHLEIIKEEDGTKRVIEVQKPKGERLMP